MDRPRRLARSPSSAWARSRQAGRRPEQRGFLVAARRPPSRPRCSRARAVTSDPNDIPTLVVYEPAPAASPRTTSRRWTSRPREMSPSSTASRTRAPVARGLRAGARSSCPRTGGRLVVLTFNFGKNGWKDMPGTPPRTSATSRQIDGVTVHLAGSGGQAADSAEAFDGIDTNLSADRASAWSSSSCCSPTAARALDAPDHLRGGRPSPSPVASSTSSPSTPTSRSTARARRSWASW